MSKARCHTEERGGAEIRSVTRRIAREFAQGGALPQAAAVAKRASVAFGVAAAVVAQAAAVVALASAVAFAAEADATRTAGAPIAASGDACFESFVLTREAASAFSRIALDCVAREYPNKPGHVMNDSAEVRPPAELHPAFYGCFDWHSAVHGHWLLVRLLRAYPDLPEGARMRAALERSFTPENMRAEAAYFLQAGRQSFERTYGWAWLLKLAEEVRRWDDPRARAWELALAPLVEVIVERYVDFLPRQTYPIRRGVHPNTAFGIAFALDYARTAGDGDLELLLERRARDYYLGDRDCPAAWEPDGDDFFSPCLMEADLMRRVLEAREFGRWLDLFLPGLAGRQPAALLQPAHVSDRTDPKIVHLDGLNLSRAWCMMGIASVLEPDDPRRGTLEDAACRHAQAALDHVASGSYEGEHWLASFAVYLLSENR